VLSFEKTRLLLDDEFRITLNKDPSNFTLYIQLVIILIWLY